MYGHQHRSLYPARAACTGNESLELVGESEVMITYNDQIKNFTIREVASETQYLLIRN